ncbi:SHOCT domain-containing protein [Halorussus marinus]|uniref:SHOCT domain-containing protein n=1 Tax=Halorussus marinus TaxID=2505976 RepID=UPI00106E3BD1|nr:SHOCT domain-containing protein [Halorussus marinus]
MTASTAERFRENATEIVSTVVTGIWMAALFTGQDWWLAALLFGYVVVVPVVELLYGDDGDGELEDLSDGEADSEWWTDLYGDGRTADESDRDETAETNNREALETLRERYARGELTDEQFERKLERLLDTETLENVEDRADRDRLRE